MRGVHGSKAFLFLIILIAVFLRLWGTVHEGFAFTFDVGRDLLAVRDIAVNKKLTLLGPTTGIHGLFYGPFWYYFLTIPFVVFNGDPTGIAVFLGLVGLLAVAGAYFLGKILWRDKALSLIFSALVAFSPMMIGFSSQIWNPNLQPIFIIGWLFALVFFLQGKNLAAFFLGLFAGLALESQAAFGFMFLISQVLGAVIVFKERLKKEVLVHYLSGLFLVFLPRIIFELRHDFLVSRNLTNFLFREGFNQGGASLWQRLTERAVAFWGTWNNSLTHETAIFGLLLLVLTLVSFVLYWPKFEPIEKRLIIYLSLVVIFLYLLFSFYSGDFWWYYVTHGLSAIFIFLFIFGLKALGNFLPPGLIWPAILIYLIYLLNPYTVIKGLSEPYWEGDASVYRNGKAVVERIFNDAAGEPFNYIVYTPPVIPHTYNYLFIWLAETKHGNLPKQDNQRLLYVIIEPGGVESLREAWLREYEDDGEIVWEKRMAGDIILQKRIRE